MIATLIFQSSDSGASSAVDPAQVTGWDVAGAVAVAVLAVPIGAFVATIAKRMLRRVPGIPDSIVTDVGRLVKWLVYLIAFAVAMTFLGVTVGWLSIVVVVILLLAVLMVKPMVENIAAGMLMTMRPSFNVGDQIQTDEYRGTVTEIGSRTTSLDTSNGISIHIPNVEVADKVIEVYTAHDSREAGVSFSVDFTTDLDDLTNRLLKAIVALDIVEDKPTPTVRASGFFEGVITMKVSFWYPSSHTSDSAAKDAVVRSIQATLTDAGITPAMNRLTVEESATAVRPGSAERRPSGKKPADSPTSDNTSVSSPPDTTADADQDASS